MNKLVESIFEEDGIIRSLRNIRYANAIERVQEFIRSRENGVLLQNMQAGDFPIFQEIESRKMAELSGRISLMVSEEVYPAIFAYVKSKHGNHLHQFFSETGEDLFESLSIQVQHTATHFNEEEDLVIARWCYDRIGTFTFNKETGKREVYLFLDAIFEDFPEEELTEESLFDFLFQILLHEMLHVVSSHLYYEKEEEFAIRRALIIRRNITWKESPIDWEDLVMQSGFSYSFAGPYINENDEGYYRWYPVLHVHVNEAITEAIASRIYHEYTEKKYWTPRKYRMSYKKEVWNFYTALASFSREIWRTSNEVFHDIEAGYFFWEDVQIKAFSEIISPMLPHFWLVMDPVSGDFVEAK